MSYSPKEWSNAHVDTLNQMMDPIDILTEQELQNELSLYANVKFTFDMLPGMAAQDKPTTLKEQYYRQQQQQTVHHHQQQQHQSSTLNRPHSLNLNISSSSHQQQFDDNLSTPSTTISSPSIEYSHYYMNHTPHSSLPSTPITTTPSSSSSYHHYQQQHHPFDPFHSIIQEQNSSIHSNSASPSTSSSTSSSLTKKTTRTRKRTKSSTTILNKDDIDLVKRKMKNDNKVVEEHVDDNNNNEEEEEEEEGETLDPDALKLEKRRRNTAASARFRVKKKLREQALQRTACEMTEKANLLQLRVYELEQEVKWLKALLIEKNN
ncbi:unnamed protein product [Cunninghamella blakesleeana]